MHKGLLLPGAGGSPAFWRPVAERLPADWSKILFAWPGLGDQPHDPNLDSLEDLVRLVEAQIDRPIDLIAQSMGGIIAARNSDCPARCRAETGPGRHVRRHRYRSISSRRL